MSFLKNLFFKSPEKIEGRGDEYFNSGAFGPAKIEYESALVKFKKAAGDGNADIKRVTDKIVKSRESLALQHFANGEQLMEADLAHEALPLFELALELTEDPALSRKIEACGKEIRQDIHVKPEKTEYHTEPTKDTGGSSSDEDFEALLAALPEQVADEYSRYGENFKEGYLALGHGDFEKASKMLGLAMEEIPQSGEGFIPLELATALLNLGQVDRARELMEGFMSHHTDSIPGCHIYCEICWEAGDLEAALSMLEKMDDSGSVSDFIQLKSETLCRGDRFAEAESICRKYLESSQWDEPVALSLARTLELGGDPDGARGVYADIMGSCAGCGRMPDFYVMRKFADLSYDGGDYSERVLEMYLGFAKQDPENSSIYYRKISAIYSSLGNDTEAERFLSFSEAQ